MKIHSDIMLNMDNQRCTLLILLDLSAAFDTINHDILINILRNQFGIAGDVLKWLKSYLSSRKQHIIVKTAKSINFPLDCGVPQGSCLGPILFL